MNQLALIPSDTRTTALPVHPSRQELYDLYIKARSCMWTPDEIDMSTDLAVYTRLPKNIQHMINIVLSFFASFDELVNCNLLDHVIDKVPIMEAKYFYHFQLMMEDIHAIVYSSLIDTMIISGEDREYYLNSVENFDIIRRMAAFLNSTDTSSLGEILVRQGIAEGIFFQSMFFLIYWIRATCNVPGLTQSNELIARDESLHAQFATVLYARYLKPEHKLNEAQFNALICEGVALSIELSQVILDDSLTGINRKLMADYVQQIADVLCVQFGYTELYRVRANAPFMERLGRTSKDQFFEKRVTNYALGEDSVHTKNIELLDDF